jgi:protein-S-isoprenylcysteine O-methyltransferase Ste14
MTVRGIGHMFEYFVFPAVLVLIVISFIFKPLFSYRIIPYFVLVISGIIFAIAGIFINLISMKKIIPAFKEGKLVTTGTFKYSRNPTYASVIFLVIPSISFFFDSFLLLSCVLLAFIVFKLLIKNEEQFLEKVFGEEYLAYKRTVGQLIPKIGQSRID